MDTLLIFYGCRLLGAAGCLREQDSCHCREGKIGASRVLRREEFTFLSVQVTTHEREILTGLYAVIAPLARFRVVGISDAPWMIMKSSRRLQRQIEIVIRYGMAHEIPHLEIQPIRSIEHDLAELRVKAESHPAQRSA